MRVRFLSVADFAGANTFTDAEPRFMCLPLEGDQVSIVTNGFEYPKIVTPDEMAELCFRFRVLKQEVTWDVTTPSLNQAGTATLYWGNTLVTNELEILTSVVGEFPELVLSTGTTASWTDTPGGAGGGVSGPGALARLDPGATAYYYDPAQELFLPRVPISFFINATLGFTNSDLSSDPGYGGAGEPVAVLDSFDFLGVAAPCYLIIPEGSTVNSFSSSVVGETWWEYRDSGGANPIWDATTGAQLEDYATLEE